MLLFEVKIRDSNYDEMAHINKKSLHDVVNVVNSVLQKEGLNERIVLTNSNVESEVKI